MKRERRKAKGERKWRLIQRIGYSEDPRVIEPLIKIVQSEKESMDNRKAALNSLAVTKDKGKAIPFLKQILNDENFKIQVARLLIDNGYGTGVEIGILETYAKQGHPDVLFDYKLISTKPMKSQVVYYKELDARNILMELTNHKDEEVRAKSVFYLLKDFNEKEFALSKLDEILNSENKQVREYGKGILRKIEDEKSKKKLQELEYQELQKELKNAEQKKDTKEDKK